MSEPGGIVNVSRVVGPDGREGALLSAGEWLVFLPPRDALGVALAIAEVVISIGADEDRRRAEES